MTDQWQHLKQLRKNHLQRLQILELQAASYGLSVPPHILIEIEDIRSKLKALDAELAEIEKLTKDTPGT